MKVIRVNKYEIEFENHTILTSENNDFNNECSYFENDNSIYDTHLLNFSYLTVKHFEGLEFDLTNENYIGILYGIGITLMATNKKIIIIPCFAHSNADEADYVNLLVYNNKTGYKYSLDIYCTQQLDETLFIPDFGI